MIRRGLQCILVGIITVLGAAPCLAQSTAFPTYVVLQGFTNNDINGYYIPVGTVGTNGATRLQRFEDDGQAPRYWITVDRRGGDSEAATQIRSLFIHASTNYSVWLYLNQENIAFFPATWNPSKWFGSNLAPISAPGTAINGFTVPPDEFQQAFPDWASASGKIPLGFSFAMSFWAVCIVATIGMKWAKELASAAS